MKRAVLFSRVSTDVQQYESQTVELENEATRLGYTETIKIQYKESAIRLSIDERQGIQELYSVIEADPTIDCVIIYEISRLSRQMTQLYELRDYFISHSLQLVCIKPYFRLLEDGKLSQTASILFSLMGTLSESEMAIKLDRMRRGKIYKRDQGRWIGGRILLGYRVGADDRIEIDHTDSETVRKIFHWYSEGKSMVWIARELKERGLVDGRWGNINVMITSIHNMLVRCEYTGRRGDTYNYPRIISDELYNKVQLLMTRNKAKTITRRRYLGQGLIREKDTNLLMSPNTTCYRTSRIDMHTALILSTKTIEDWLWDVCSQRARESTTEHAHAIFLHDQQVLNNKIHTTTIQIQKLQERIEKVQRRIVESKIDELSGDKMIQEYNDEIDRLNITHNQLIDKLLNLKPNEVDLSDKKQVVQNEIQCIYASNYGMDGKTRLKLLEVYFRDGSVDNYLYKSRSNKSWIEKV